jgi:phosphate-selective porin OprO/OprP
MKGSSVTKLLQIAAFPAVLLAPLVAFAQNAPPAEAAQPAAVAKPAEAAQPAAVAKPEVAATPTAAETPAAAAEGGENASTEASTEGEPAPAAADVPAADAPAPLVEVKAVEVVEEATAVLAEEVHPTAGYDKGFFIQSEDGKFKLGLGGRLQARFTRVSEDPGDGSPTEYGYDFSIPRARIQLKGHAYSEDLTYKFQADFGKGSVSLKDYYVDYRFFDGLQLRVGQDKRPFSRQQMTSSGDQQFVDRAITDKAFGAGRDIGILLHNDYLTAEGLEYAFGIYNGSGEKSNFSGSGTADLTTGEVTVDSGSFTNVPVKMEPTLVARVGYNGGIKGYSESDLEGGAFRYGVGLSGLSDMNVNETGDSKMRLELDGIAKVQGFSFTGAFYISSEQTGESYFGDRRGEAVGGHLQGGYVIDGLIEPALRWASVSMPGETDAEDVTVTAYTAGLNVFFEGHKMKWSNDFTILLEEPGEGDTATGTEFRSQVQFAF